MSEEASGESWIPTTLRYSIEPSHGALTPDQPFFEASAVRGEVPTTWGLSLFRFATPAPSDTRVHRTARVYVAPAGSGRTSAVLETALGTSSWGEIADLNTSDLDAGHRWFRDQICERERSASRGRGR